MADSGGLFFTQNVRRAKGGITNFGEK